MTNCFLDVRDVVVNTTEEVLASWSLRSLTEGGHKEGTVREPNGKIVDSNRMI